MYKKLFVLSALVLASCSKEIVEPVDPTLSDVPEIIRDYTQGNLLTPTIYNFNQPSSATQEAASHLFYNETFDRLFPPHDLAIIDYNNDGILDAITGNSEYQRSFAGEDSRQEILFLKGNADGTMEIDTTVLPGELGPYHSRKSLVADFNLDGYPDVFFVSHGTDKPPFQG